jgi:hypothetical protein
VSVRGASALLAGWLPGDDADAVADNEGKDAEMSEKDLLRYVRFRLVPTRSDKPDQLIGPTS